MYPIKRSKNTSSGKNRISVGNLYKFAKNLDFPIEYFFADVPGTRPLNSSSDQILYRNKNNVQEKEIAAMLASFTEITNPRQRKFIIGLLEAIGGANA